MFSTIRTKPRLKYTNKSNKNCDHGSRTLKGPVVSEGGPTPASFSAQTLNSHSEPSIRSSMVMRRPEIDFRFTYYQ